MQVSKPGENVCSSKEQSHLISKSEEYHVNQHVMYEEKDETSKQECQGNVISMDDKNCQCTLCSDKNCQDTMCVYMQPVKPIMKKTNHMQLAIPAILQSEYKKQNQMKNKSVCDDKNCQSSNKHNFEECPVRPVSLCNDKNCQSDKPMCYDKKCEVKSEGTQFYSLQSRSKMLANRLGNSMK